MLGARAGLTAWEAMLAAGTSPDFTCSTLCCFLSSIAMNLLSFYSTDVPLLFRIRSVSAELSPVGSVKVTELKSADEV